MLVVWRYTVSVAIPCLFLELSCFGTMAFVELRTVGCIDVGVYA